MRRDLACMLMVVVAALGGGCGGGPGSHPVATPGDMPEGMKAGSAAVGDKTLISGFRPTKVRVHPLTRLETEGAARHLVLQVELTDAWGHTCKWPGIVRVELKGATVEGQTTGAGSVWWMDLREPEANAKSFDGITQTYVLRVPVKTGGGEVSVDVSWTEADGKGGSVTLGAAALMVK